MDFYAQAFGQVRIAVRAIQPRDCGPRMKALLTRRRMKLSPCVWRPTTPETVWPLAHPQRQSWFDPV